MTNKGLFPERLKGVSSKRGILQATASIYDLFTSNFASKNDCAKVNLIRKLNFPQIFNEVEKHLR